MKTTKSILTCIIIIILALSQITTSAAPTTLTAIPTSSTVYIDGNLTSFDSFNINDNNYFKLRDLAYSLSGTSKQFDVNWDGEKNAIMLTSGKPYTVIGGEMSGKSVDTKVPSPTYSKIYLDGNEVSFTAYIIDGNNYFKLRNIGETFDFAVIWDSDSNAIHVDTSLGYDDEQTAEKYAVERVIDGDTFEIHYGGTLEKVRLIGVDAPESVHPDASKNVEYGKVASEFTTGYLLGKDVTLEFDVQQRDQYGRLLAYVWIGGELFNEILVGCGHAQVATYPPNVKYVERLTAAQTSAREKAVGVWAKTESTQSSTPPDEGAASGTMTTGMVWVPKTGTKYHSYSGCSNMKNPSCVTLDYARSHGYTACSKCW